MNRLMLLSIILVLSSCAKDSGDDTIFDAGYNYFPILDIGTTYLYKLDVITYNNEGKEVTNEVIYQRNTVIESEVKSQEIGSYRVEVWESRTGQEPWLYKENFVSEINKLQAIDSELDSRIIKITFPIAEGKSWNGLTLMDNNGVQQINGEAIDFYKNWDFKILGFDDFDSYTNVLNIQQADHENALEKRYSLEKYAQGIGLIYKEQEILDTQCLAECVDQNWEEKAHHGIILKKKLVSIN